MLMHRAYEGDETRQLVFDGHGASGSTQVQSSRALGLRPRSLQKGNKIERLFRRLKGFRRIFSWFEKLDVLFLGFLNTP